MLRIVFSTVLLCSLFLVGKAQEEEAVYNLKSSDVENFISKFPEIKSEFEKMEIKYDNESHEFNLPEGVEYLNDVNNIVQKNGYKDYSEFFLITASILTSYASIKYDEESGDIQPEIKEAIQEIDDNPALTPEQKKQMKEYLTQSMDAMQQMSESLADSENIKVVKPYVDKIEVMMEEE